MLYELYKNIGNLLFPEIIVYHSTTITNLAPLNENKSLRLPGIKLLSSEKCNSMYTSVQSECKITLFPIEIICIYLSMKYNPITFSEYIISYLLKNKIFNPYYWSYPQWLKCF